MENLYIPVSNVLKELGIPANLSGYHHIRYGLMLIVKDMSLIKYITKGLYPALAEHFKSTPSKIERTIRHAIEVSWDRGNLEFQDKLFGYTICSKKGKPTNSEFLATLADYIVMMRDYKGKDGAE